MRRPLPGNPSNQRCDDRFVQGLDIPGKVAEQDPRAPGQRRRRPAEGAERRGEVGDDVDVRPVERVAQYQDGFGVAFEHQIAREEQRIAVAPPLEQLDERHERSPHGRVGPLPVIVVGDAEVGFAGAERERQANREIDRIDDDELAVKHR